jgi:L-arabinokinase
LSNRASIHFALTSHGLGHVTRSLAVIRALHELRPEAPVVISSTVDPAWLDGQLGFPVRHRHRGYEPGAVQRDCFSVDVPATIAAYESFGERRDDLLEEEIRFLRSNGIAAVVSDIPALPVAAAGRLGIPAIGVSNFTWDWILEPWCGPGEGHLVDMLRADYAAGTLQLCLPFGPDRSSFPEREAAPLLARKSVVPRDTVRDRLELGTGPVAVVCLGGWDVADLPAIHARTGRFGLVVTNGLRVTADVPCRHLGRTLPAGISLPDLVNAADVVLGKPGYGLASECLAHRVPFAMIERSDFRESPHLVAQLRRMGRCTTMSVETFYSGDWESVLETALVEGSDWAELEAAPARSIASRILSLLA